MAQMSLPDRPDAALGREAIEFRRLPWMRPLLTAYATDFASVAPLFAGDPSTPAAWRDVIGRVNAGRCNRDAIATIILGQISRRNGPPEASAGARRLGEPQSVAILTGQQAGLFGGPLYTLLKAITTLQLARKVEQEHGIPVVPVFWADAEDHDWEEVRTCRVLDREMPVCISALPPTGGAGPQPVGRLHLASRIDGAIAAVPGALAPP